MAGVEWSSYKIMSTMLCLLMLLFCWCPSGLYAFGGQQTANRFLYDQPMLGLVSQAADQGQPKVSSSRMLLIGSTIEFPQSAKGIEILNDMRGKLVGSDSNLRQDERQNKKYQEEEKEEAKNRIEEKLKTTSDRMMGSQDAQQVMPVLERSNERPGRREESSEKPRILKGWGIGGGGWWLG